MRILGNNTSPQKIETARRIRLMQMMVQPLLSYPQHVQRRPYPDRQEEKKRPMPTIATMSDLRHLATSSMEDACNH